MKLFLFGILFFAMVIIPSGVVAYEDEEEAVEAIISFVGGIALSYCEHYAACRVIVGGIGLCISIMVLFAIIAGAISWRNIFSRRNIHNGFCLTAGYMAGSQIQ